MVTRWGRAKGDLDGPVDGSDDGLEEGALLKLGLLEGDDDEEDSGPSHWATQMASAKKSSRRALRERRQLDNCCMTMAHGPCPCINCLLADVRQHIAPMIMM